ncbi:MAG: response regulator [Saccharospirillum sp.]
MTQPTGTPMQTEQQKRILVVDDDEDIRNLLQAYLERNGFRVDVVADGQAMRQQWPLQPADLIVLDIMLPGDDGFTLCKFVRSKSNVPIIMLTAGSDETDRIIGLELGADDYVGKPFNPRELLARIKAVLRRYEEAPDTVGMPGAQKLQFGDWCLDLNNRELTSPGGDAHSLNGADFNLLRLFLTHPGQVLSRDDLSNHLRGRDASPFDRSIDVQVSRLRSRLNDDGKSPHLIKTVRGEGYVLTVPVVAG